VKLAGKVLVVTGAGSGIARAVTLEAVTPRCECRRGRPQYGDAGGDQNLGGGRRQGFDPCPEPYGPGGREGSAPGRCPRALRSPHRRHNEGPTGTVTRAVTNLGRILEIGPFGQSDSCITAVLKSDWALRVVSEQS
jgi:hypothetical protein